MVRLLRDTSVPIMGEVIMKRRESGFTLIEIAIVLVIIGLLLGGVLKGQELITGARVRNLASQQDGVKAAYFGFLDRYRALPGDYKEAVANIPNMSNAATCNSGNGNGNGNIQPGTGTGFAYENLLAWEMLSKAGFINGSYTCAATASTATSPANPYSGLLDLRFDDFYGGTATSRHNLKTGSQVPSDILAELDRKVDDGNPEQGSFRGTGFFNATSAKAPATTCADTAWKTTTVDSNCAGTTLF